MTLVVELKLLCITTTVLCCLSKTASSLRMRTASLGDVYVDNIAGNDSNICGSMEAPCKSLLFSWNKFLADHGNSSISEVIFNLASSDCIEYKEHFLAQPLSHRCTNSSVTDITVKSRHPDAFVQLCYSLQITSCNFNLIGVDFRSHSNITTTDSKVHIKRCLVENRNVVYFTFLTSRVDFEYVRFSNLSNSRNQMLFLRSQHVTFKNSHFRWINLDDVTKSFVDIEAAEGIALEHCVISHNNGVQNSSRLFLIENVGETILANLSILENTNLVMQITGVNTPRPQNLIIDDLKILHSVNTTLEVENISANVLRVLVESLLNSDQPLVSFKNSNVDIENLQIACVGKRRYERSPISVDSLTKVTCNNCSTSRCKNICGQGSEIVQGVFCRQCPVGTSAHDWERVCRHCHPGFYSSKPGATDCIPCEKDKFCKKKGCSVCKDCGNDFFTSNPGSSSCSQMSQFFIIMLGIALFLIMTPIAVKVICRNRPLSDEVTDDYDESKRGACDKRYKRFDNNDKKDEIDNKDSSDDDEEDDDDDNDDGDIKHVNYPSSKHSVNSSFVT